MVWIYKGIFLKHACIQKTYKYSSLSDICYNFLTVTVGKSGKGADFLPEATLARANQALTRGSHQFSTPSYRFNKYIQSQCNNTLPSGGIYWKIRPPRIKRFAKAGILHPEALNIARGQSWGRRISNASLLEPVYWHSVFKRGRYGWKDGWIVLTVLSSIHFRSGKKNVIN